MPEEGVPHKRTWMGFGPTSDVWGESLLPIVRANLVSVATAIAAYEPVSFLARKDDMDELKGLVANATGSNAGLAANITLVEAKIDDLWLRDTGPTAGVDFNFNGWGNKQEHADDATVARQVTEIAGVPRVTTALVLEGGALEVDGNGTAIITESCVLNDNRNPGWSKDQVEQELKFLIGVQKIIWLPGIKGKDITDAHTDFYARFVSPGQVVAAYDPNPESYDHNVTLEHLDILRNATDLQGRKLNVTVLTAPTKLRSLADDPKNADNFAAGYINFYTVNGAVIAPQFGDEEADTAAKNTLQSLYPDRTVVMLDIDGIAAGGGGIHCSTQQEFRHDGGAALNATGPATSAISATGGGASASATATPSRAERCVPAGALAALVAAAALLL
ncbi:hypothetical protein VHUM_03572 [Vanrija humicola]|uniref:Agmatine deiminase n=1 Tax=Vanrija humicola TaxID=5417 RepID=A0A7D8UZR0_VANHU|nr:hypothetical protein VHUM_03572 [Vanrija humicola]